MNDNNINEEKNGQVRDPNELINESSPYLLQHAYNPVDWMPWGEEAFQKAKKEDKPIFLSIGYSTCHWCHVMAHESFEDPKVASLINETFVPIKVDKEERPDIDKIYMTVCHMMTRRGGWPLTIIMTSEKKPFFAGTYIPKNGRFGQPGLIDLIKQIQDLWENDREKALEAGEDITLALENVTSESPGEVPDKKTLKNAMEQLSARFDDENGGFGSAPKFPTPHNLFFLLRMWKRTENKKVLKMVEDTMQAMRKGGIYDHIGYGFHRYSTDSEWKLPHFEKMLYDNALLAIAYIETFKETKEGRYAQTAREIFTYIFRDMTSSEGGFYSAEDADVEGEEGKFYIWKMEELESVLTDQEIDIIKKVYNIEEEGNFEEEATKQKIGKNILYMTDSIGELATKLELTIEELKTRLDKIRQKLFKEREKRQKPSKDDKILTDWNGLMIAALAKASRVFDDSRYLDAAEKAVDFILTNLRDAEGRLLHRYRNGNADVGAFIDDYAFFIWSLIEMYETTFKITYLETALELNQILIDEFWDEDIAGFFFTSKKSEEMLTRQKEIYDGAIPSGNSVAMLNLLRLSLITGDHSLEEKAEYIARVFAESIEENPVAHAQLLVAIDFALGPTYSLVIAGDQSSADTRGFLNTMHSEYLPNTVLIYRPTDVNSPEIDTISSYIEGFSEKNGKTAAYVCSGYACKSPTTKIEKTIGLLNPKWEST
ncbi:MAG: thioredoxin domain-containing protein [Promethearchaeia archaeon]